MSTYYNFYEIIDGLILIFHRLLAEKLCEASIRAHPHENPHQLIRRWESLFGPLPSSLQIGRDEPLDQVLSQTDVGLMFHSTVMLNCLSRNIPVIVPGWFDFTWNRDLTGLPGLFLAGDLPDLERQIRAWLENPPEEKGETCAYFVRPPGERREGLKGFLRTLMAEAQ